MSKSITKKNKSHSTPQPHNKRRLFGTGFAMGMADLVPGVSGGTMAFLLGVYEELLYSIKHITGTTLKLLLKGKFKLAWSSLPLAFLVPLLAGIIIAIFTLASLASYLIDNYSVYVWSTFFGLVVGSVLVVRKRVKFWNIARLTALVSGALGIYVIVGLAAEQAASGSLMLLLTGMIAFCAMILPGISGSLIMVIMGQYEIVLEAVSDRNLGVLIYVALGGLIGLALFARLLSWLLKNYHGVMVAFLIGMMLGSLRKLWPWRESVDSQQGSIGSYTQQQNVAPVWDWSLVISLLLFAAALLLILRLEKLGIAREHTEDIPDKSFRKEHKEGLRTG